MSKILVLFSLVLCQVIARAEDRYWQGLRITWSMADDITTDPYAFAKLPIKREDAIKEGYKLMKPNPNFKGDRYINNSDPTTILIFDPKGSHRFVGYQIQLPVSEVTKSMLPWFERPYFMKEKRKFKNYFVTTIYTIDPDTIGTPKAETCRNPAGNGFWYQTGPNAERKNILKIPNSTDNIDPMWIRGKCVDRMARHYAVNVTENMDCKNLPPFVALYINNTLSGLNSLFMSRFDDLPRLELPPNDPSVFFYKYSDCISKWYDEAGAISTFHHYINPNPDQFKCPTDED